MQDGKSLVPGGENQYHAIFGGNPAYFVSASSLGPALAALGAHVKIASPSGARTVAVDKFFVIPKSETDREIDLHPNEIVTEIVIPSASASMKNATYEVRQKEALDWPLATASVALKMSGGKVASAHIVMGHVAPTPWGAAAAEKALIGKSIDEASAEHAAAAAVEGAQPLSQNEYKVQLAKVAVKRALLAAAQEGIEWSSPVQPEWTRIAASGCAGKACSCCRKATCLTPATGCSGAISLSSASGPMRNSPTITSATRPVRAMRLCSAVFLALAANCLAQSADMLAAHNAVRARVKVPAVDLVRKTGRGGAALG